MMRYLISRVDRTGSHFFDASTMRFFNSRALPATLTQIDADHFRFVTSEKFDYYTARSYTVRSVTFYREADKNGTPRERVTIDTVGEFQEHATARDARKHLRDDVETL